MPGALRGDDDRHQVVLRSFPALAGDVHRVLLQAAPGLNRALRQGWIARDPRQDVVHQRTQVCTVACVPEEAEDDRERELRGDLLDEVA